MYNCLDISCELAERMREPEHLIETMRSKIGSGNYYAVTWPDFSFAWGLSGIASYYAILHRHFDGEGWDRVAHNYLIICKQMLEKTPSSNISLFFGLAGLSLSVYWCSEEKKRYRQYLHNLDILLIEKIQKSYLDPIKQFLDPSKRVTSSYYDLAHGLSGAILYLLKRKEMQQLCYVCVEALTKVLFTPRKIQSGQVYPWYHPPDGLYPELQQGYYRLDVPYGLPGVLGTLSQALKKGICPPNLLEWITQTTQWLLDRSIDTSSWDAIAPVKKTENTHTASLQRNWFSGAPASLFCLYLSAEATENLSLKKFCEHALYSHLREIVDQNCCEDTSFACGKAGLLFLAYQMGCKSENPSFFSLAKELESALLMCFKPEHTFGFQSLAKLDSNAPVFIDNPCFLNGAIGISLTLLHVQRRESTPWEEVMLLV